MLNDIPKAKPYENKDEKNQEESKSMLNGSKR